MRRQRRARVVLVLLGISIAVGIAMTTFLVLNPGYGMPRRLVRPDTQWDLWFGEAFFFLHSVHMGWNGGVSGLFIDALIGTLHVFFLFMIPTAGWWIVCDGLRFVHTRIRRA